MKTLISFLALFVALSVDAASTLYVGRFVGDGAGTTNHYSSNIVDSLTLTIGDGLSSVQSGTDLTLSVNPNSAIASLWRTNATDGTITNVNGGNLSAGVSVIGLLYANNSLTETNPFSGGTVSLVGGNVNSKGGQFNGSGAGLTNIPPTSYPITNFTSYASGTAYTLTGTSAQLDFGTTDPIVTINQAGTYLIQANVGVKYSGATYANAQTVTFKLRRTNNTAADLTSGSRTVEMPFLVAGAAFTGGDVMTLPPVVYQATAGDTIGVFGILSATPPAGSVTTDSCEIVAIRLY